MKRHWVFGAIKMMTFAVVLVLVAGVAVMLLWNALVPAIFGTAPITWLQAVGLLVLARLLVGGRRAFGGHYGWRRRWESKVAAMSPEERQKWKEEFGGYCCGVRPTGRTDRSAKGEPIATETPA